jgi:Pectate lyase superfamily protein
MNLKKRSEIARLVLIIIIIFAMRNSFNAEAKAKIFTKFREDNNTNNQFKKQNKSNDLETEKIFSVKDFGAVGNNSDDTKAIQTAIDLASQQGGGTVFFPSGIYIVSINPATLHAITIRSKVILKGDGKDRSIIKLADAQGNYDSILSGENPDSDLSDFAMYDLGFDGNIANNPLISETDFHEKNMRYSLRIYVGSRIKIERCKFTNQKNINVITLNGNVAPFNVYVSDVLIKDNNFELIGGGNVDHDHSTIYTHGERIEISNNYFSSKDGTGTNGARTAIEIHGDEHIVKNNHIIGFTNGINITGYASSSNNQVITDNIIQEAHTGIIIWSFFSWGNTTNPAIENCNISKNKISLNVNGWLKLLNDSPTGGIVLYDDSDAPIKNLNIAHNEIIFQNFSQQNQDTDNRANGIRLNRSLRNIESENISIIGNIIENSLSSGIYIDMIIRTGQISDNTILNSSLSNANLDENYRSAILLDGVFDNVKVNKNRIISSEKVNRLMSGIVWNASCNSCEANENILDAQDTDKLQIIRYKSH